MRKNLRIMFVWFIVGLVLSTGFAGTISWLNRNTNGIHAHEDGRTVFIEGEACVINMDAQDTKILDLNDRYIWCQLLHEDWLATQ